MFDTHAHLNFSAYKNDLPAVIDRLREKKITIINVGSQFSTSQRAVEMAEKYENMYAAVALHPFHLFEQSVEELVDETEKVVIHSRAEEFNFDKYLELAKSSARVVAVGECGLDFHYEGSNDATARSKQMEVFINQIELANALNLPMILHCRDGYDELIAILREHPLLRRGVAHCFGGNMAQALTLTEMGYYIGFTGVITFKNKVLELHDIVKALSSNKILSETDCPYLAPVPYRGQRNEPAFVELVVAKIAELRGWSLSEAEKVLDANAKRLFNI